MIQLVLGWLFVIIAICFIAVAVVQYLFGGIRLVRPGTDDHRRRRRCSCPLLVAAFVLLKAVQYWYDRYELLFSNRGGTFTGASYTDINAVLPAKLILMLIAAICAVGFVVGAFTRSIKLPAHRARPAGAVQRADRRCLAAGAAAGGGQPQRHQPGAGVHRPQHRRDPHRVPDPATTRSTTWTTRAQLAGDPGRRSSTTRTPCPTPGCWTRTCCRRRSPSSSSCGTSTASPTSWPWTATR